MSALPPKADMRGAQAYVRYVPIADILPFMRSVALLISMYRHRAAMAAY